MINASRIAKKYLSAHADDLKEMWDRLQQITDDHDALISDARGFGMRVAAIPAGTMTWDEASKIVSGFDASTKELSDYIRSFNMAGVPASMKADAEALLAKAKGELVRFQSDKEKADAAFKVYEKEVAWDSLKELMSNMEKVLTSAGLTAEYKVVPTPLKIVSSPGTIQGFAQIIISSKGYLGESERAVIKLWSDVKANVTCKVYTPTGYGEYGRANGWMNTPGTWTPLAQSQRVIRQVISEIRNAGHTVALDSEDVLEPDVNTRITEIANEVQAALAHVWNETFSSTRKVRRSIIQGKDVDTIDLSFNIGRAQVRLSVGAAVGEPTLYAEVRHKFENYRDYNLPWKKEETLIAETTKLLAKEIITQLRVVADQYNYEVFKPTKSHGTIDIQALQQKYPKGQGIYMVSPNEVNPKTPFVRPGSPVTHQGYTFFLGGGGRYVDGFLGELIDQGSGHGWTFNKVPVGNNADVTRQVNIAWRKWNDADDARAISSN